MNFKARSNEWVKAFILKLTRTERAVTIQILYLLCEIQSRRLYADYGVSSLFEYCVKILKYTESQAHRRIAAAKLLKEFPQIEEKVTNGTLSLSSLSQAQTFFRQEAKAEKPLAPQQKQVVLQKLENQSTRSSERILASLSSKPAQVVERMRAVSDSLTEVRFGADEQFMKDLKRLKELHSHKNPNASYAELMKVVLHEYLEKHDPQIKAERAVEKEKKKRAEKQRSVSTARKLNPQSRPIAAHTIHRVRLRDGGGCTFVDKDGRRCGSKFQVEIDHVVPVARGGTNDEANLRLLCRTHNLSHAMRCFGPSKMNRYLQGDKPK